MNTNTNTAPAPVLSPTQRAALAALERGKARPIRVVFAIALVALLGACGARSSAPTLPAPAPAPALELSECYARGLTVVDSATFVMDAPAPIFDGGVCNHVYTFGAVIAIGSGEPGDVIYAAYDAALMSSDTSALAWCEGHAECASELGLDRPIVWPAHQFATCETDAECAERTGRDY